MISFKQFVLEANDVNEVFGLFKKMKMSRGAKRIASEVVIEKIIKPALKNFSDAFENISVEEKKGGNYIVGGYEFVINLDVTDKYMTRMYDSNFVSYKLVKNVESEVKKSYDSWKKANKDDIYSEMITNPNVMATHAGNVKNSKGEFEQNISISFRILNGSINIPK